MAKHIFRSRTPKRTSPSTDVSYQFRRRPTEVISARLFYGVRQAVLWFPTPCVVSRDLRARTPSLFRSWRPFYHYLAFSAMVLMRLVGAQASGAVAQ
jgi:hypothetical protein